MKNLKYSIWAFSFISLSALAQTPFTGFYGQVGTGSEKNTLNNTSITRLSDNSNNGGTMTNTGVPVVGTLGYNFSVNQNFVLGLGAEYSTTSFTSEYTANGVVGTGVFFPMNYKLSNRYSVFASPGYVINQSGLIYAKLGYSSQKIELNNNQGINLSTANMGGYLAGLGYKQKIYGGLYGFLEANYYSYASKSLSGRNSQQGYPNSGYVVTVNPSASAYNGLIGIGYQFD